MSSGWVSRRLHRGLPLHSLMKARFRLKIRAARQRKYGQKVKLPVSLHLIILKHLILIIGSSSGIRRNLHHMIIWDFNVIIALAITISLGVVIVLWVFYTLSAGRTEVKSNREYFRQCGFCGYLYLDYFKKTPGHCPRCGSYQN